MLTNSTREGAPSIGPVPKNGSGSKNGGDLIKIKKGKGEKRKKGRRKGRKKGEKKRKKEGKKRRGRKRE